MTINVEVPVVTANGQVFQVLTPLPWPDTYEYYRSKRLPDNLPCIIKAAPADADTSAVLNRFRNELRLSDLLHGTAAVPALAVKRLGARSALVLEDVGANPLTQSPVSRLDLSTWLSLAIDLAGALASVHARGVVHKDLKPAHIWLDQLTSKVRLTGFGIAAELPRTNTPLAAPTHLEGTLAYMAPEQTGRMNRPVDFRADLYSLGIVLYEQLTGMLPFEVKDQLEWVHCHVAKLPVRPTALVPGIPLIISDLVMRLLAKDADERYQSAAGVRFDLERCLAAELAPGGNAPFSLGEGDVPDRLTIRRRLYGRETDIATLTAAWERVATTGQPELVLVSGYSGIGKSTLVHQLFPSVIGRHGRLVTAKSESLRSATPLATMTRIIEDLVRGIQTEGDERVEACRRRLQASLGPNARIAVDLVPLLSLLLGNTLPVAELPPYEAESRLLRVVSQLILAFTNSERPLAIFIDDLQWADLLTIKLFESLASDRDATYLLLTGAYRSNEVSTSHPLAVATQALRRRGCRISEIVLAPLFEQDVHRFVADSLNRTTCDVDALAAVIYAKTLGNPFFMIQFLTALTARDLLRFDRDGGGWQWSQAAIEAEGFTDNIVDLMIRKLSELPTATQKALRLAACIGSKVPLEILSLVCNIPGETLAIMLEPAVTAGLIVAREELVFLHDRIQEAAYQLVPLDQRAAEHLWIGRQLAEESQTQTLLERRFEVVDQLNLGASLIIDADERTHLAVLNLEVGRLAKRTSAFGSARGYLSKGLNLLSGDYWKAQHELAFMLASEEAECTFLTRDLAGTSLLLDELERHAQGAEESANVACQRIVLLSVLDRYDEAVRTGIRWLRHEDVDLPEHPTRSEAKQAIAAFYQELGDRPITDLANLPPMTDRHARAVVDVLMTVANSVAIAALDLLPVIVGRAATLCLRHGNVESSSYAYVALGLTDCSINDEFERSLRLGQAALSLIERQSPSPWEVKVLHVFWEYVAIWTLPVARCLEGLRHTQDVAEHAGDPQFQSYAWVHRADLLIRACAPFEEIESEIAVGLDFSRRHELSAIVDIILIIERYVKCLRGASESRGSLDGEGIDEQLFLSHLRATYPSMPLLQAFFHIRKLQARFLFGQPAEALAAAVDFEALELNIFQINKVDYRFYAAMAGARRWDEVEVAARSALRDLVAAHHAPLEAWAARSPANFGDRATLVGAELARLDGHAEDAIRLYEKAIGLAQEQGFLDHQAIAYEAAARFYHHFGATQIGDYCLRSARSCWARWGATGKVAQLDRELSRPAELPREALATLAASAGQLDVLSLVKATQSISAEIVETSLVRRLLHLAAEQSGARRACLIEIKEGEGDGHGEAELRLGEQGDELAFAMTVVTDLPQTVIRFVLRTQQCVIMSDANSTISLGPFASDEYLMRAHPRSILCLPIIRQGRSIGVLYLENEAATGVFTRERVAVLEVLAAQAAISLENTRLIEGEHKARLDAEMAHRQAAFLAEASALLTATLDPNDVLAGLASLSVRSVADWCVIDLMEGGTIQRKAATHADPSKQAMLDLLQRLFPVRHGSPHPAARVISNGEPLLFDSWNAEELRRYCQSDEHAHLLTEIGIASSMTVPLRVRGQVLGALTLAFASPERILGKADLTLAQDLADRAAMALDNANLYEQSQRAVALREEFLAVAAHELRTPLTPLKMMMELLESIHTGGDAPLSGEKLNALFQSSKRQITQLDRLINDLVETTRLESGTPTLDRSHTDLAALVRRVVEAMQEPLAKARCAPELTLEDGVTGDWDQGRIEQVVNNLLANVIRYAAGKPVKISVQQARYMAVLRVEDAGIGIAPVDQERIFERFTRAASYRAYGGLGLGLYISRKIVEAHGGTIQVASVPDKGSIFTVELPTDLH